MLCGLLIADRGRTLKNLNLTLPIILQVKECLSILISCVFKITENLSDSLTLIVLFCITIPMITIDLSFTIS